MNIGGYQIPEDQTDLFTKAQAKLAQATGIELERESAEFLMDELGMSLNELTDPEIAEELKTKFKRMDKLVDELELVEKEEPVAKPTATSPVKREEKISKDEFLKNFPEINGKALDSIGRTIDRNTTPDQIIDFILKETHKNNPYVADKALDYLKTYNDYPATDRAVIVENISKAQKKLRLDPIHGRVIVVGKAIDQAIDTYDKTIAPTERKTIRALANEIMGIAKDSYGNTIEIKGYNNIARALLTQEYDKKKISAMLKFISMRVRPDMQDPNLAGIDTKAILTKYMDLFKTMQAIVAILNYQDKCLPRLKSDLAKDSGLDTSKSEAA